MTFGFDKIYVLNLITNKDRREFIKKQFDDLGIEFEFIYGVDFKNITSTINKEKIIYPNIWNNKNGPNIKTKFNGGDFGCIIAHYQAVLQAYEFGYNNVLIFEDDICFIKNKELIYEYLKDLPKDADFISWDPRFWNLLEQNTLIKEINNSNTMYFNLSNNYKSLIGGMMYSIMNRNSMKIYLEVQRNRLTMSDHVLGFFENPKIKRYLCTKCIALEQHLIAINFDKSKIVSGHTSIYLFLTSYHKDQFNYPKKYIEFSRENRDENRQLLNNQE